MIFEPPRHTKSELVSRRLPAWIFGKHPNWQMIEATYSGDFAADFGLEVRGILRDELYQNLFPGTELRQDSQAANKWRTTEGGIYVAAGVGGPVTGRGAHVFLIDDPLKDWSEADSETVRESRWNWYLTVARTRMMPGGGILLTQTRWHDDDMAGRLIRQMEEGIGEKFKVISLPAIAEKNDVLGRKPGEALWPEWYPIEELEAIRSVLPRRHWASLYQQNPVPDEGDFFKRDDIQWYDHRPKHLKIYAASDYAVTEDNGDWTELGVAGVDPDDDLYILDWWRGQTGPEEWIEAQLDLVHRHKPLWFAGEGGVIRRAIEPMLRKRMRERKDYCKLEWLPSVSDKPTRARGIQARTTMKKVYLPRNAPWADELLRQMLRFPQGEVDDGVDVLSLFGRMLDKVSAARLPEKTVDEGPKPGTFDWLITYDERETERSKYRPRST